MEIALGGHYRDHRSVLARSEKRLLVWMAERLPRNLTPDHLTILGAVAMIATGAAFALASTSRQALVLVPIMLAINWFGDSLDGTLARVRGIQRPRYGYYVDHVVDVANTTVLFSGLAYSGLVHPIIAAALLVAYLMVSAESFLAAHSLGVFRISFAGFGPTELRILLSVGALVAIDRPVVNPFGLGHYRLFDIGCGIGAGALILVFIVNAARNTAALYRAEPIPNRT